MVSQMPAHEEAVRIRVNGHHQASAQTSVPSAVTDTKAESRDSLVAQWRRIRLQLGAWVRSLHWEDPLEKGTATHSSLLAWRIPWTGQFRGLQRVRHD